MWIIQKVSVSNGRRLATADDEPELIAEDGTVMTFKTLYAIGYFRSAPDGDSYFVEVERLDSLRGAKREIHYLNGGDK